ncbi:Elongation factor Tu GTP binding domain family protein [Brugia pahangi]
MPQTKFVLSKALKADLKPIVIINKVDRPDSRIDEVLNEIYELFFNLDATNEQLDFPVLYASGRNGWCIKELSDKRKDLSPLFSTVTLITKQNWLVKFIKLSGFAFETADDEDLVIQNNIRNQMLRSISSPAFGLYFHTIRRKKNIFSDEFASQNFPNFFANYVNLKWREKHATRQSFINDLYITIIRRADTKGVEFLSHLLKKFGHVTSKHAWESDMRATYEDLEETTNRVMTNLRRSEKRNETYLE